jgi:hypothetical protein
MRMRRRGAVLVVGLVAALTGVLTLAVPQAQAATTSASCGSYEYYPGVGFQYQPWGNNKHVTTEYWNGARLVASSTSVERRYNLLYCWDLGAWIILDRGNQKVVAAELGYTGSNYGLLRSRTSITSLGAWEQFNLWCKSAATGYQWRLQYTLPTDCFTFVFQSLANGDYVSAEFGWDGRLRARATSIGGWEQFFIT